MPSIIAAMTLMIAIPLAVALVFHLVLALRGPGVDSALVARFHHEPGGDGVVELELIAAVAARRMRVERFILERPFAARVLAQPPNGFRERHPAPPPDYDVFTPHLDDDLATRGVVDPRTVEAEKRRQHTDLVRSWADMCESVVMWEGRIEVRAGRGCRVRIPLRTDVAASGRVTIIYSYRSGFLRTNGTYTAEYRPRLVAVHG